MLKCIYISLLFLYGFHHAYSQQNHRWYFGKKAALSFASNPPAVITGSAMDANEGSASICNNAGDLLFYTNGVTVYNKSNQVMLNGDGLNGNISSVQAAIIVPNPGDPDIFYIFTSDALESDFVKGYCYSVVDMSRDGGKGEVVNKNVPLFAPGTERMTAARHADGTSVWIITNDKSSNTFRSWLVGCNGISLSPVISHAGVTLNSYPLQNVGMMKVSPDGKQLCQTHFPYFDEELSNPNFFQLFDFDNATGMISNARTVNLGDAQVTGCEYSPNSQLLYLARPYDKKMDQVEANLATPANIVASRYTFSTGTSMFFGIQMAPDQKIYLSQPSSWLGAINYPNIKGAGCNYRDQQLDVSGGAGASGYIGLPSFINDLSFDGANNFTYTILDSCTGSVQFNGFSTVPGPLTWDWDFGDGNTSNLQNPIHNFSAANPRYTVKLKIQSATGCGLMERSKEIIPQGLILNAGFDFVGRCDSGYVRFVNTSTFFPDTARIQWVWDFGDLSTSGQQDPIHSFASGSYNVQLTVKTTTACLDQTVSKPINFELVTVQAPPDQEIDAGSSVQLNTTGNGTSFLWMPPAGLSSASVPNPVAKPAVHTTYIVKAFNDAGCEASDTVRITVKRAPGVYVPTGFTPNNDGKNDVIRPLLSEEFDLEEFTIYNRWGERIFSTFIENVGWNGKVNGITQDSGAYVWVVRAIDTRSKEKIEKKGTFVLLR